MKKRTKSSEKTDVAIKYFLDGRIAYVTRQMVGFGKARYRWQVDTPMRGGICSGWASYDPIDVVSELAALLGFEEWDWVDRRVFDKGSLASKLGWVKGDEQ